MDRFLTYDNHIFRTVRDTIDNDAKSSRRFIFDRYNVFLNALTATSCKHDGEKRIEYRQYRSNDESATKITICTLCDSIVR